jgi:arabinogalactan oligomer/maltooligosaccharide transport system substrate-binding protein
MKKKVLSTLLVAALTASLFAGCTSSTTTKAPASGDNNGTTAEGGADEGGADAELQRPVLEDYGSGEIKIWVADNVVDLTKEYAEKFLASDPAYSGYTVVVEPVGEGDAAGNMITDVEAGADIYGFAQDQLTRLVVAGALYDISGSYYEQFVKKNNDGGAILAASVGDAIRAFPVTSDNGYFLYYDKSIVTDTSTLEAVVEACEAAGKNFYFDIENGWYQTAFFFGTGCELTYDTDKDGNFTNCNINYNSDAGLVAMKEMIDLVASPSFQNGSSVGKAVNCAAIVDGVWDSGAAKDMFGDNYAACKLPEFVGSDGKTYQLSGFGGNKLLGVKPQTSEGKAIVCLNMAEYLSSAEVQLARFESQGWGPSNLEAQQNEAVQADPALAALAAQLNYAIPQGQYPGDYWTRATALVQDITSDNLTVDSSDDDIMAVLAQFEADCKSYAGQ